MLPIIKCGGAFGETNYEKKVIRINKKIHQKAKKKSLWGFPKKDSTIIDTLVHETLHKNHPKMHEKTVRRKAKVLVKKMGKKAKSKLYSKVS